MKKIALLCIGMLASCQPVTEGGPEGPIQRSRAIDLLRIAEPSQQELQSAVAELIPKAQLAPGGLAVNRVAYFHSEKVAENLDTENQIIGVGDPASIDYSFLYAVTQETQYTSISGTISASFVFDGEKFVRNELSASETAFGVTDVMLGKVTVCETGAALYKATIHIAFRDGHEKRLYTSQDGTYEIRAVKGEAITVSAWAEGYELERVETFVPDEVDFELCPPLPPPADTFALQGTVRDLDGELIAGALISVTTLDHATLDSTLTNNGGTYALTGLPETAWSVTAARDGKWTEALLALTSPVNQVDMVIPNHRPVCSINLSTLTPVYGQSITVAVSAFDAESDPISIAAQVSGGVLTGSLATRVWTAPSTSGTQTVSVTAGDGMAQGTCSASVSVSAPPAPEPETQTTQVPLTAGGLHSCAILADKTVRCWGRNVEGQLGNGMYTSSGTPVTVANLANVVQITAGSYHSCARTATGAALCWGRNTWGQLGIGSYTSKSTPVALTSLGNNVTQIEAGFNYTCAVVAPDSAVMCWGLNNSAQIGNGSYNLSSGPNVPVSVLLADGTPLTGVERIEAGGGHVCALKNGALLCWGSSVYGANSLGNNAGPDHCDSPSYPALALNCAKRAYPSEASAGVVDFIAAEYATCALFQTGAIKCWGDNRGYQLGNSAQADTCTTIDGSVPCSYHGLTVMSAPQQPYLGMQSFSSGSPIYFGCGNDVSGTVMCWGAIDLTAWSQPNNGTPNVVAMSNIVTNLKGLASGYYHVCGSTTGGAVYCWGNNGDYQLGKATNAPTSVAVRVPGF